MGLIRSKIKHLLRLLFMVIASIGILWLLKIIGFLNLQLFLDAFKQNKIRIASIISVLIFVVVLGIVKLFYLLKLVAINTKFSEVAGASFISQAIGQWFPGSMVVTDVFRFGLMVGIGKKSEFSNDFQENSILKSRIAVALFIDRVFGLGMMFIVGSACSIFLILAHDPNVKYPAILFLLTLLSLIIGISFLLIPFVAHAIFMNKLSTYLETKAQRLISGKKKNSRLSQFITRIFTALASILKTLDQALMNRRALINPLILSLSICLLNSLAFYLSALSISRHIPFLVILILVPFTILSMLLPLGFAGYGGQQLMAVGVFGLFEVNPETVVASSLVLTTLALAVYTFCGGISAGLWSNRLRSAVKKSDPSDSII